jgi:hypothetical protein
MVVALLLVVATSSLAGQEGKQSDQSKRIAALILQLGPPVLATARFGSGTWSNVPSFTISTDIRLRFWA